MQDDIDPYTVSLTDLRPVEWLQEMKELGTEFGFFEPLGKHHNAAFVEKGDTLLVSFESLPAIQALSDDARPIGFDLARDKGWSCLTVISNRDTWFRDGEVYGFFDQMTDDGFFRRLRSGDLLRGRPLWLCRLRLFRGSPRSGRDRA